jgi:hypothetical protein
VLRVRQAVVGLLVVLAVLLPVGYIWTQINRPQEVTGTVLAVRARPPLGVDSFDLLTTDGRRLTFRVGPLDLSPGGFDAPHLVTHQVTTMPVTVSYHADGDVLVATRLADAKPSP